MRTCVAKASVLIVATEVISVLPILDTDFSWLPHLPALTRDDHSSILVFMAKSSPQTVTEQELKKLEFRLDELVQTRLVMAAPKVGVLQDLYTLYAKHRTTFAPRLQDLDVVAQVACGGQEALVGHHHRGSEIAGQTDLAQLLGLR